MKLAHVLVVEGPLGPCRLPELRSVVPGALRPYLLYSALSLVCNTLFVAAFYEGVYLSLCGL